MLPFTTPLGEPKQGREKLQIHVLLTQNRFDGMAINICEAAQENPVRVAPGGAEL